MSPLEALALTYSVFVVCYLVVWNVMQVAIGAVAIGFVGRHERRRTPRARALAGELPAPPQVSVIVPARNEELTIVASVRALLALDYESCEIVVVNDGSTDATLEVLRRTFDLLPAPWAQPQPLPSAPVRAVYRSLHEPALVVLDKENGGSKADAANAGINAASGALVLAVDADTVLEPDALSRAALPFFEDPTVVAVGANVGIANGCRIEGGRVLDIALPRTWLARLQVVEYMRAFLLFRVACAAMNGLATISGAFGVFRRDAVIAVGGYDGTAIGEDMDLTLRLQQYFRARRLPCRIAFEPRPLSWTQAPEDLGSLARQRYRWRRGLLQVLWRRRRMIGNPRYGPVGVGVLPYILVFDGLGPLMEIVGYVGGAAAAFAGVMDWSHYGMFVAVAVLFGAASTLTAVLLSDIATRRYMGSRDLALLAAVALLENCGYRQLNSWWGFVGTLQAIAGVDGWGAIKRQAFEGEEARV